MTETLSDQSIFTQSPCICGNLRRASRLATKIYDTYFQPIDIKVTQYSLLLAIQRLEPVTITQLADEVVLDRTACTRNLNILEDKGLICLEQGRDKRMKHIRLTGKGSQKIKDALPLWQEAQKAMFQKIGQAQSLALLNSLTRMVSLLR